MKRLIARVLFWLTKLAFCALLGALIAFLIWLDKVRFVL